MSKRKKFVVTSAVLTLGFLGMQLVDDSYRFLAIAVLSLGTLALFGWSLKEGLGPNTTLLALVLPFLFTIGVGLFWFLLPANVFTRIPALFLYGFGIYALCLTTNIYSVSTIRTIALLRAARGVGFVLTMFTAFLLYDEITSLKVGVVFTPLLVGLVSIPLLLQGFWAIVLEKTFTPALIKMTGVSSVVIAEIALILYFWPVTLIVGSLFLTVSIYVLLGLGQARLESRLFKTTVREYLFVGLVVLLGMFVATRWTGY